MVLSTLMGAACVVLCRSRPRAAKLPSSSSPLHDPQLANRRWLQFFPPTPVFSQIRPRQNDDLISPSFLLPSSSSSPDNMEGSGNSSPLLSCCSQHLIHLHPPLHIAHQAITSTPPIFGAISFNQKVCWMDAHPTTTKTHFHPGQSDSYPLSCSTGCTGLADLTPLLLLKNGGRMLLTY